AAIADVNNDGRPDVVASIRYASGTSCAQIATWLQNSDHTFPSSPSWIATANRCTAVLQVNIADIDGDGKPDLIASGQNGEFNGTITPVFWYSGNGDGSFNLSTNPGGSLPTNKELTQVSGIGDINEDGRPDVIIGQQSVTENGAFLAENYSYETL